jgi:ribose transport system substrate-binding protein
MLQTALDKKPAAICFAALDSKAATPLLEKAKAAGIPVVGFDSGVDSDIPVTTVTTDNLAAAGEAADKMAELIGDAGKVAVIVHDQTSRTGIDRRDGFLQQMEAKHPNIEVVAVEDGAGDPVKSADFAKASYGQPGLKGFFGANEGSIKGVSTRSRRPGRARSWLSATTPASSRLTPSRAASWPAPSPRTRSASAPSASTLPWTPLPARHSR